MLFNPQTSGSTWKVSGVLLTLALGGFIFLLAEDLLHESHHPLVFVFLVLLACFLILLIRDSWVTAFRHQEQIEQLMGLKLALASLIDLKDRYTEGHSRRVRDLALAFARFLNLEPKVCDEIALAAELHDIGKIGIPDAILNKPDSLDGEEYDAIRAHPQLGADALKTLPGLDRVRAMIRHHHERFDGTGYPDRHSGDQIPLGARIITLSDSYDSMLRGRIYRPAMSPAQVRQVLQRESGKQFDPGLTPQFLKFLNKETFSGLLDPVCGMRVDPKSTRFQTQDGNRIVTFCSQTCLRVFQDSPETYKAMVAEVRPDSGRPSC